MRAATRIATQVEEHYRPATLAERLGVSRKTIMRACARGRQTSGREGIWPWRKPERTIIIPASAVSRWLEAGTAR